MSQKQLKDGNNDRKAPEGNVQEPQQGGENRRKDKKKQAHELIERGEGVTIKRKTNDTNVHANLLAANDYFLFKLRMNVGPGNPYYKIPVDKFTDLLDKSLALKLQLNELNNEMALLLNETYTTPRGLLVETPANGVAEN